VVESIETAEAPTLALERDGDLANLVIEGPPANELSFAVFDALAELVEHVLPALDVRGLVISGRGRHFSSGSNVAKLLERASSNGHTPSWCEVHSEHFQALARLPYPVVAAVSGCCLGSGLELALACAARVAADNAVFALPESQHGLIPGCGGTVNLTGLIGYRRALRLILSGELLGAAEALELGLVDVVVRRQDVHATARRLVERLAKGRGI
jgi:enoyl-CoA hydratase/carnithine racemase